MEWRIIYALPNVKLSKPFDARFISIVPYNDERIGLICKSNCSAEKLMKCFVNEINESIEPSALILNVNAPLQVKTNEAVSAFRNIVAISVIMREWGNVRQGNNSFGPLFSNSFDFFLLTPSLFGGFNCKTPAVDSFLSENVPLIGMPSICVPVATVFEYDTVIFANLIKIWELVYVRRMKNADYIKILRSLEIAYHALSVPMKNESTIFDFGVNISLWVSALEILAHNGYANKKRVIELLGKYKWKNSKLNARWYTVVLNKSRGIKEKVNLIQKMYDDLYVARNSFLHGDRVTYRKLYLFEDKNKKHKLIFAPIIYRFTLYNKINELFSLRKLPGDYFIHELPYEECLLAREQI